MQITNCVKQGTRLSCVSQQHHFFSLHLQFKRTFRLLRIMSDTDTPWMSTCFCFCFCFFTLYWHRDIFMWKHRKNLAPIGGSFLKMPRLCPPINPRKHNFLKTLLLWMSTSALVKKNLLYEMDNNVSSGVSWLHLVVLLSTVSFN